MTTAPAAIDTNPAETSGNGSGVSLDEAWETVRAEASIQYAPVPPKDVPPDPPPSDPPAWLEAFSRWLQQLFEPLGGTFASSWPVIKWVLIAGAAAFALILLWKLLSPLLGYSRKAASEVEQEWTPDQAEAVVLLADADRLAGAGRYDEATHLLLRRSVSQIAAARPEWVEPASTARELAMLPALPDAARTAFGVIAERVERSLFALRTLGEDDWRAARSAYANFALHPLTEQR